MVFDHHEAVALAIGLCDVSQSTDATTAEALLCALAKLTAMLPTTVRQKIKLMSSVTDTNPMIRRLAPPAADVPGAIAQACRDGVRLTFDYGAADGAQTTRYVEPYRLVVLGQRWYLVAYDLDRNDWRTFRADRATNAAPFRNSFTARPSRRRTWPATSTNEFSKCGPLSTSSSSPPSFAAHVVQFAARCTSAALGQGT